MFFDVRAAKLLKPGEHLSLEGCPGLRLEASASRRAWTYRYKSIATGQMKQIKIGIWPAMSVQSAASEWEAMKKLRSAGEDPGKLRRAERKEAISGPLPVPVGYTVRTLVDAFLSGHIDAERNAAGALAARRSLKRLLEEEPEFASSAPDSVTRSACFDLLESRKATPTTTQKLRSLLGSAWEYAHDAGKLDQNAPNWWRLVMKGKLKSKGKVIGGKNVGQQRRGLRDFEIAELVDWLPNMNENGRDGFLMYLWTCARGVEFFGARPEHITTEGKVTWWTVPKTLTKNARFPDAVDLRVPLFGRALEIMERRAKAVKKQGWLFATDGGEQYQQHRFSTYIYDLQPYSAKTMRRAGEGLVLPVGNWSPHNLRRTSRTLLSSIGCPKEYAEAIMGHMPEAIEATYNCFSYDPQRILWLGRLSKKLEAIIQAGFPARP